MTRICIAVLGTTLLAVNSVELQADTRTDRSAWEPTRNEKRSLFPNDPEGAKPRTRESTEFFPADQPRVRKKTVQPAVFPNAAPRTPRVRPASVQHPKFRLKEDRPVFPLRTALQPPPAPPSGGKLPPSPTGGPMMPTNPMDPMQGTTPAGESGFSAPFDRSGPQLLEVDQVFSSPASGCDNGDCGCDDWCHRHCWLRSTCDMPLREWYRPEKHGYYYFRPYNYQHVLQHSQLAPVLQGNPRAPYETTMFEKFYAEVPGLDAFQREELKPLDDAEKALPLLEDVLGSAGETPKKSVKMPTMPPEPKLPMKPKGKK